MYGQHWFVVDSGLRVSILTNFGAQPGEKHEVSTAEYLYFYFKRKTSRLVRYCNCHCLHVPEKALAAQCDTSTFHQDDQDTSNSNTRQKSLERRGEDSSPCMALSNLNIRANNTELSLVMELSGYCTDIVRTLLPANIFFFTHGMQKPFYRINVFRLMTGLPSFYN